MSIVEEPVWDKLICDFFQSYCVEFVCAAARLYQALAKR